MVIALKRNPNRIRSTILILAVIAAMAAASVHLRADEPYARNRDYDLQHSKIALRFDVEQKKVIGDVTHTLAILRDGTPKVAFDSVGLTIQSVTVNKAPAKFESTASKLIIPLPAPARSGDKFDVDIRYEGRPAKGLYFILPDKDYPDRPQQIWTQGESEDTRYYLPTYDYPNDRLTTETILTVPASWITVANGMENSSATTNTSSSLRSPKLIPEFPGDEDPLISHELAHQWFGDLVTCNDWGDIWLNEGFATFFEMVWTESHYPKEQADYERWMAVQEWLGQPNLYSQPVVRHEFDESSAIVG